MNESSWLCFDHLDSLCDVIRRGTSVFRIIRVYAKTPEYVGQSARGEGWCSLPRHGGPSSPTMNLDALLKTLLTGGSTLSDSGVLRKIRVLSIFHLVFILLKVKRDQMFPGTSFFAVNFLYIKRLLYNRKG